MDLIKNMERDLNKLWLQANSEKSLERSRELRERALIIYRQIKKQKQLIGVN
jgi:hypothetical protein